MEQHQSDRKAEDSFADTYNGLLGMAKKAGFNSVGDAIRAASTKPTADLSHLTSTSIRDYPDFTEDVLRLSEPGLARKQAKIIRKAIYDTIDARVRNSIIAAQVVCENADVQSLLATKPAAAPQDQQQDLHVAPPTRGTDSQHAASDSVLTIEKIMQLIDEHTDRDFGLIVEPFARAIESEVTLHLSSTTKAADGDRYRWLVETFGQTKLPAFLERNTDLCGYVADGKESIDTVIDWARAKSAASTMASTDAVIEAREQDAARYRKLRDLMRFSEGSDGKATMTLSAPLPAPHHDFKVDWIADRFDVSVNMTVDALPDEDGDDDLQAAGAEVAR